ncbi:MAG: hypothetical protein JSS32_06690 [Verrucomicrobia bacterium]|nr:hypothetical protein [Verrucomicrobiota bacterium]
MNRMTPDEKFLLKLYETAKKSGDLEQENDSILVAKEVGLKETAVKNIVKHLAQANFVKKGDGTMVHLTSHGCRFVEEYLQ